MHVFEPRCTALGRFQYPHPGPFICGQTTWVCEVVWKARYIPKTTFVQTSAHTQAVCPTSDGTRMVGGVEIDPALYVGAPSIRGPVGSASGGANPPGRFACSCLSTPPIFIGAGGQRDAHGPLGWFRRASIFGGCVARTRTPLYVTWPTSICWTIADPKGPLMYGPQHHRMANRNTPHHAGPISCGKPAWVCDKGCFGNAPCCPHELTHPSRFYHRRMVQHGESQIGRFAPF